MLRWSTRYREQRDALLDAERALIKQREEVAVMRRKLPLGPAMTGTYTFEEGPSDLNIERSEIFSRTLPDLFGTQHDTLLVIHFMFGLGWEKPCPMCSLLADHYNTAAPYVTQRTHLVLIARQKLSIIRAWARKRGWRNLRVVSSMDDDFNRDLGVEESAERPLPALSVFKRKKGVIHHFYTTEGSLNYTHHRALDLFMPEWHLFDLLPEGRGEWLPSLEK